VQASKSEFDRRQVSIVVISFAEPAKLVHYQQRHQWRFVMLADPNRLVYRSFTLKRLSWFHVFSPVTIKLYFRLLREGKKLENYGKDDYHQSGGDFVVDRDGRVLFAYRSQEPADRPTVSKLLEEIDRIRK